MTDNPYQSPDESSRMDLSKPKPRPLGKRIALAFLFSVLLGVFALFVAGFVGSIVARSTFDPDMYSRQITDFGLDSVRAVHNLSLAEHYGTVGFLVGASLPWLHLFYTSCTR